MQPSGSIVRLLLAACLVPCACVEADDEGSVVTISVSEEVEYLDKSEVLQALEANGGVAVTPSGEKIVLNDDDLCNSPTAHIRAPDGYELVPNPSQTGFVLVPEGVDAASFRVKQLASDGAVECSGNCTDGCSPYAISGNVSGCTGGCTKCTLSFQ